MPGIFYTADGRKMNLEGFADAGPSPASSLEDSLRLKGNLSLDGTIRAGKFLMADGSEMKTVIQEQKVAAIPETVTFDAQGNMAVGSKGNNNKLLFSTKWTGFPDDKPNGAEISNDTDGFKQLMIVGNKSAGGVRTVGVWDKLNVNGQLCVGSKCVDENSFGGGGGAAGGAITGKKGNGWGSAVNVDAPQEAESLYSLHFGDGKALHERQCGMGYIKGQPDAAKQFGNTRGTLGMHIHQDDDFQIYSSGWNPLFGVKGGSGDVKVKGAMNVNGPMTVNKMTFLKKDNSGDNDPYYLEKIGSGADNHHLRLTINDNEDESFQIWGNSCAAGNCGGEGKLAHKFVANGNAEMTGKLTAMGGFNSMIDNRVDKQNPKWYRDKGVGEYTEFKDQNWEGLPGYSYIKTIVPWGDITGGRVKQIAYSDDGMRIRRGAANDSSWENWKWPGPF